MKHLLYFIAFLSLNIYSQEKYLTRSGKVNFEASVPSFEEVKAENNSTTAILNTANGEFAALVLVKGFRFKNALMEEHFNENYAESDKFPKASFKGTIINFSVDKLNNEKTFKINGELTFHGKTKMFENIAVDLKKDGEMINMTGNFKTEASEFDIKIPKIVSKKIAETIDVQFDFNLKKK
ncbi:YceI family protein [Gaetbulibacter saemankumensis]|uniref:YceI family protein n=1 Tax=Gaetbulibacter saemankumensis TaxID=311208 RepID=UPI0004134089|nr:YceI family protein [Gaetbulibacter saemankumensis]